jgi:periplasmic protein TonB
VDAADAETQKAADAAKALADAAKAKDEAARKAREASETAASAPAPVVQAPPPVVQAPLPPVVQAPPPPVVQAPAPAAKAAITPISTPQPPYPREALLAGTKGEVVAEISINGAGDVTSVRIISASPRNVFDKTVISTVRRWKYRGNGDSTTIRRTFAFN